MIGLIEEYRYWARANFGSKMLESESEDEQQFEQELLNWVCLACMVCGMIWAVFIWHHLGPCVTAFIPLSFTLIVAPFYIHSHLTNNIILLAKAQSLSIIFVPWGIQLSLGNYASGMAIIWGILGPICGLFFLTKRQAVQLFIIFIINSAVATCLNPMLTRDAALASEDFVSTFYAMNISLPAMVVFGALWYTFTRLSSQRGKMGMLLKDTETKNKSLLDSITYAEYLQRAILPAFSGFRNSHAESFLYLRPKDIVSGDFFWTAELDGRTYFAVCDCTGHGVPGSLVSIICNNSLMTALNDLELSEPGIILDKTRALVVSAFAQSDLQIKDGMDIGLCCIDGDMLLFSGAKHSLYIKRAAEETIEEIKGSRQSIGFSIQEKQFTTHVLKLRPDDRIYMSTDGFPDQFGGPTNKKFRTSRFKQLLLDTAHLTISEQETALERTMAKWMEGQDQLDDMCVLGIHFRPHS